MDESMTGSVMEIVIPISFALVIYVINKRAKNKRQKSIIEREKKYVNLTLNPSDTVGAKASVAGVSLVAGMAVVPEALLYDGKREATVKMKEAAARLGADEIINFRMETVIIRKRTRDGGGSIGIIAYGTAIRYKGDNTR